MQVYDYTVIHNCVQTKTKNESILKLLRHHFNVSLWVKFQANKGASCQQAIMVLSDGTTSSLSDLFEEQNPDKKVYPDKTFIWYVNDIKLKHCTSAPCEILSYGNLIRKSHNFILICTLCICNQTC